MTDSDTPATRRHHRKRVRSVTLIVGHITTRTHEPVPTGHRPHPHHRTRRSRVALELLTTQQVTLTVNAEDAAGVVVADPGTRTWASTDETVVTVSAPDADGTVTVVAVGAPGTATVTVSDVEPDTADGTAGATFVGSLDFIVSTPADPITQIAIVAGTPTDKPAAS